MAQLDAIQAKRASLRMVLEMFDTDQKMALNTKSTSAPTAIAAAAITSPTATPAKVSLSRQKPQAKSKAAPSRKSSSPKAIGQGWREYVRDEYRKTPLPAVVAEVLKSQPKKVFEIAKVIDAIFVKTITPAARTSARERVSNILAEGARKKRWYRGKSGCYRFSK